MRLKAVRRESRNGAAYVLPTPMATHYLKPTRRVLFWPQRDANPFFHLMEALWILAGRRDVEWISRFSKQIATYSDNGINYNGAYGYRWRHWFGVDQLQLVVKALRANPNCRRQVLTMWDGMRDLKFQETKDVPCNLSAAVQVDVTGRLSIMVNNRSNDLIWGAHGANAVQFSVLLEVLAALIGVPVGTYTQVSMNSHIYEHHWEMAGKLAEFAPDVMSGERLEDADPYETGEVRTYPMVSDPSRWWTDLELFMTGATRGYGNPFFPDVALPVMESWFLFKEKNDPNRIERSKERLQDCEASDWRLAGLEWLDRRKEP